MKKVYSGIHKRQVNWRTSLKSPVTHQEKATWLNRKPDQGCVLTGDLPEREPHGQDAQTHTNAQTPAVTEKLINTGAYSSHIRLTQFHQSQVLPKMWRLGAFEILPVRLKNRCSGEHWLLSDRGCTLSLTRHRPLPEALFLLRKR